MLDKSVPYFSVFMHREKGTLVPVYELPAGYKFSFFRSGSGDEEAWAKIETSVLEFADEPAALAYFQKDYLPHSSTLERRCMFVENADGEKIATSTAWWCCPEQCDPWLHWVAVMPQYQGLGLGKAIISRVTQLMLELEGDEDFYLHTQTWSHRAIKIYEKVGYAITKKEKLCHNKNESYDQAIAVLKDISEKREIL